MFDIRCTCPLDENWLQRDALIQRAAGSKSHRTITTGKTGSTKVGERCYLWLEADFQRAVQLGKRLKKVKGVLAVSVAEHNSVED